MSLSYVPPLCHFLRAITPHNRTLLCFEILYVQVGTRESQTIISLAAAQQHSTTQHLTLTASKTERRAGKLIRVIKVGRDVYVDSSFRANIQLVLATSGCPCTHREQISVVENLGPLIR